MMFHDEIKVPSAFHTYSIPIPLRASMMEKKLLKVTLCFTVNGNSNMNKIDDVLSNVNLNKNNDVLSYVNLNKIDGVLSNVNFF